MLQTVYIVTGPVPGYGVVVSPGVRHLKVHGDIITIAGMREIFELLVILTNINLLIFFLFNK